MHGERCQGPFQLLLWTDFEKKQGTNSLHACMQAQSLMVHAVMAGGVAVRSLGAFVSQWAVLLQLGSELVVLDGL